jgi:hypothetical protein
MSANPPESPPPALRSVRGLVLATNVAGELVERTALRKWFRLSLEKFKAQKVDLCVPQATADAVLPLLEEATHLGLRLSLRTTPDTPPDILSSLAEAGLLDVALEPDALTVEALTPWVRAVESASLPLRLFIDGTRIPKPLDDDLVALIARANSVRIGLHDGIDPKKCPSALPNDTTDRIVGLTSALQARGTEVHCLDIPFCQVPESLWPSIHQGAQQIAHHQHYRPAALEFAHQVRNLPPARIHGAVEISLGEGTSFHNRIDDAVLPWILERPWYFFWIWFLHKLTRRLRLRKPKPVAFPEEISELEAALLGHREEGQRLLGPTCARCAFHPICDHHTETFKQAFPGRPVKNISRPALFDPLAFFDPATAWYDAVDEERSRIGSHGEARLETARHRLATEAPTREIPAEDYAIQDHKTHRMPASVRWFSFSTAELQSTVLARLSPPFTLSVTVGGGIAQLMGFALGRHTRLMCPMTSHDHKLTLHVDANGHYVLLRDEEHVIPVAFGNGDQAPERIGTVAEPRIALANIDGQIVTQTVLLWEDEKTEASRTPTHSVILVCTKYARRLQASLMALAHQTGIPFDALEVVVGYVPGIDATDDVLDSLSETFPNLHIIRMPFATGHSRSKGFIINECLEVASGSWITFLDADILLPPDYFSRLESQSADTVFVAPEGRQMLSTGETAAVLLGISQPWKNYDLALEAAGEYRHMESEGVPPGFCQSVRRIVLNDVRYEELKHFEGSDWWFGAKVIEKFGEEERLDGLRVLHLDHGGSQWYGTGKQF